MQKTIIAVAMIAVMVSALAVNCYAADYEFSSSDDTDYYDPTAYEEVYGAEYNYGGPNVVDYMLPSLNYGSFSSTQAGSMERVTLPGLQAYVADGGGDYGITSEGSGASFFPGVQIPDTGYAVEYKEPKYTSVSGMAYSDGSIGTVSIPSLKIDLKVWEGETNASMAKGLGHYSSTSGWDGNVGVCGHNRGAKYVIGSIKDLKAGEVISYTTIYGSRTYQVTFVGVISNDDWSYLQATVDNRITITTCLADHPESRVCVQGVEIS